MTDEPVVTTGTYTATYAGWFNNLAKITAERDALQAKLDAVRVLCDAADSWGYIFAPDVLAVIAKGGGE